MIGANSTPARLVEPGAVRGLVEEVQTAETKPDGVATASWVRMRLTDTSLVPATAQELFVPRFADDCLTPLP